MTVAGGVDAQEAPPAQAAAAENNPPSLCRDDSLLIHSIELKGLGTTHQDVAKRELLNHEGEPFTCAKWALERDRLEDLDIFGDIDLQATVQDGQVNLVYAFRELPPYIPFIAVSKTEQDGLSLGPALASLNFLGLGIRAEFITRFGGTNEMQASLSSRRLYGLPIEYDLALIRVDSYNRFETFHEDSWRGKLDLVQSLEGAAHLLYAGEILFMRAGKNDTGILLSKNGDYLPRAGTGFVWDTRDRHHNPTRGWYQEVRVTKTGGWMGGPADYSEWLSDTRVYLPWLTRNTLLLSGLYQYRTGELGQTFGLYDRYHVGGVNTLRGYSNDSYQGKSELLLTLEERLDLIRKRTIRLWHWSAYYGLQGILGVDGASLWDHDALLEREIHPSLYGGLHILIAGVDRIRIECGSKFAKFQLEYDLGILDKPDIQRFRAR